MSGLARRCISTVSCLSPTRTRPWLFVGLGNPGDKYNGTRHNVGFGVIDAFGESEGILVSTPHCKALFGQGLVDGVPVLVAKPQTYMNLSGESVGPLAAYYKLPLDRVLVCHDDMGLPCGVLRLEGKGGHDRHNGLKSVIYHFRRNREFARLRVGIGRPPGQMDPKAFLLQKFNTTARGQIDAALLEGVAALKSVLLRGLTETATRFNKEQKISHSCQDKRNGRPLIGICDYWGALLHDKTVGTERNRMQPKGKPPLSENTRVVAHPISWLIFRRRISSDSLLGGSV